MNERWKEIRKKYWPPKKEQLLILVLLGLLLAVIAIPVEKKEQPKKRQNAEESNAAAAGQAEEMDYESRMEQKFSEILSQVEGMGKVEVFLTFEGSGQKNVEKDRSTSPDESREETVYEELSGSERTPYVASETNPRVEGVLVIAEGGGNSLIKQEILEAAQALFGIEPHKIKIMKMEGSK